ncbi:MAG: glycosyltransferase family 4 protein [Chloroflexi bacterium]|nr:glycosyltransferase family 4 protein [Chloroflexota bacterium]
MRVVLLTAEYPPQQGGVGDFTRELGRALCSLGAEIVVVTGVGDSEPSEPLPVHRVIPNWGWRCWPAIHQYVQTLHADVVHIQYQTAAYHLHPAINLYPLASRWVRRRVPIVVTFHDVRVPYLFPKAGPLRAWVNKALARESQVAIATNREDFLQLRAWMRPREPHLIPIGSNICPHPPADYNRDAWRARWGVRAEDWLLGYFGFLNASKGGETLIRALRLLVDTGKPAMLLMIGGRTGSSDPTNIAYAAGIDRLIEESGLRKRVQWTGYTPAEEVSANLLATDVVVLPYRDGASFRRGSFMAALAHGLPIVTTYPQVETPELVDGENVALVSVDDAEAIAARVTTLMSDPQVRQRLREGARKLSELFRWEKIAQQTLEVYRAVLAR